MIGACLLPLAVPAQLAHRDPEPLRPPAYRGRRRQHTSSGTNPSQISVHRGTAAPSTLRPVRNFRGNASYALVNVSGESTRSG
jgi:hypothetical protein